MEIEVKGHSGCSIEVVRHDGQLLIEKKTYDPKYADRLEMQALKQKSACSLKLQHIRVPKITKISKKNGSCEITMEYVYSRNFIEFFEYAGFEQIGYFFEALKIWIEQEIQECEMANIPKTIITDKFESVKQRINSNPLIANDESINRLLEECKDIFQALPTIVTLPVGKCHGDLTFSNILFNGNNFFLIDFLDSFIESPLMDMVKIKQDSKYLWSVLMYNNSYDEIRLKIISHKLDSELTSWFHQYSWYRKYYGVLQLMNFLRILQYAKEEKVVEYLKSTINDILRNEKFDCDGSC